MPDYHYGWKRFWCPRDGQMNLGDRGFLFDPDSEYGPILNPGVVPFDRIAAKPCLVLLGEPGIGKTTAMKNEFQAVYAQTRGTRDDVWLLDLGIFGSYTELSKALFDDPKFHNWLSGSYVLHLFLDALDECRLEVKTVARLLGREFGGDKLPVSRLRLRIACRTAEWPASLEGALKARWGEAQVGVYELAPLRSQDVAEAARTRELEPERFLQVVADRNVESLAAKPVSLELLLRKFIEAGDLPGTQLALYREGCKLLCGEVNQERIDARHTGTLDAHQRLAVAARIAALMFFGNRSVVWLGTAIEDFGRDCITLQELSCRETPFAEDGVEISEGTIREALNTGLFTSRGPERIGWAHQTYGEFLAADYLVRRGLAVSQMMSLIRHPMDPDGRLAPQLHGVAAWLAASAPEVFDEILRQEPEVLAQSDVATDTEGQRSALVDAVLSLMQSHPELLYECGIHYRHLLHPGLAGQLRPWLVDTSREFAARYTAIEIAQACQLQEVQKEVADIALAPNESRDLRVNAAYAISEMGDATVKALLKPLALGQAGPDPDDELKGCALRALWPGHMTSAELFALLTASDAEHGAYWTFLCLDLPREMKLADLPAALEWVARQPRRRDLPFTARHLVDAIMWLAWQHIEEPPVAKGFATTVLAQAVQYDHHIVYGENAERFRKELQEDDEKRHCLLMAMIPLLAAESAESHVFAFCVQSSVLTKDVPWLLGRLDESDDTNQQKVLADIARRVFDIGDLDQVERICAACRIHPVAKEAFGLFIEPVGVDSPEATKARKQFAKRRQFERDVSPRVDRKTRRKTPDRRERIADSLREAESKNSAGWWQLCHYLTLDENGRWAYSELEPDLKKTPGWDSIDLATRVRIIEAAKQYVLEPAPEATAWLPGHDWDHPTLAVYKALRLILTDDPEWVRGLSSDVWRRWAPIITAYPAQGNQQADIEFARLAYAHAAEEVLKTLRTLIRGATTGDVAVAAIERLDSCWDGSIAACALEHVLNPCISVHAFGSLLNRLLEHGSADGEAFARSVVSATKPIAEDQRPRAVHAAYMLLRHAANAGWDVVVPAMRADVNLCDALAKRLSDDFWISATRQKPDTPLGRLSEEQLGDLFRLLAERYPYATCHSVDGNSINGLAGCRDAVLGRLENRGTLESVRQLEQLMAGSDDLRFLSLHIRKARYLTRQTTWQGWQPGLILALVQSREKRLVENGRQLLDVIVETLEHLQEGLQGESPAAVELWDNRGDERSPVWYPVGELRLSEWIARHLREHLSERGVVVNREVQIRCDQATDIHVDAVVPGEQGQAAGAVSAIIEVKGCWNLQLDTAMENQLVGRYLKGNQCPNGVYLVGWFNCPKWSDGDYRKKGVPEYLLDEARKHFDEQAHGQQAQAGIPGLVLKSYVLNIAI